MSRASTATRPLHVPLPCLSHLPLEGLMFQRTAPRESSPSSPALHLSKYAADISPAYLKAGVAKVCSTAKWCQLRFSSRANPHLFRTWGWLALPCRSFCALRWRLMRPARVLSRGRSRRPSGPCGHLSLLACRSGAGACRAHEFNILKAVC